IIHAELGEPGLAGILEPALIACARNAPFVVAVDREESPDGIGRGDDRALLVGVQNAYGLPHTKPINRRFLALAWQIEVLHIVGAVIIPDERIAVIKE